MQFSLFPPPPLDTRADAALACGHALDALIR
jgi:hypothetical protein